jgi:TonB family protein
MFNRRLTQTLCGAILCAVELGGLCFPVFGQIPPEIEHLAERTAERLSKTQQTRILVAPLLECQFDTNLCSSFESSLLANLEKMNPTIQFVKRDSVIRLLTDKGSLALDAYNLSVLKAVGGSAGAQILVSESLRWHPDQYELIIEVDDLIKSKKLDQFRAKVTHPPQLGDEPLIFTDPDSRVSVILPRGKGSHQYGVRNVACDKCPDPAYTKEARDHSVQGAVLLFATVTEDGEAKQLIVIKGLQDGLTERALNAVQSWHFKPAVGNDGKPFAVRVPIEVTFRLF